jgi:predicted HAD superfamily Cof-like phosphohydrolase
VGCLTEAFEAVKAFHMAFNHPVNESQPSRLNFERKMARSSWMQEELDEYNDAKNMTEEADALIDLIYFAIGTFVEMGLDPSYIFDIVQEANMSKLFPDGKPHYNTQNKVIKPKEWISPNLKIRDYIESLCDVSK